MKIKNIFILSILAIIIFCKPIYADEQTSNVHNWTFIKLTKASDQDESVKVSKFYYVNDESQLGFCIEPNIKFNPSVQDYQRVLYDDEDIYKIVKAYKQLNKSDNEYYIAAQLLIWKQVSDIDYTFNGNDYSEYKQEILDIMNPSMPLLKAMANTNNGESYVGEENVIDGDYTEYDIDTQGVNILSNDKNGIKYVIEEELPEIKILNLTPKDTDDNHSYVLQSEDSQDIYFFEGDYNDRKPLKLSLKTLRSPYVSIYYSKKDMNNNNISGAEFTIYEINPNDPDYELVFIQKGVETNIYEALLNNYSSYSNLSIKISERYERYLTEQIIKPLEVGYFPYEIYEDKALIKSGIVYVSDDISQTNNDFNRFAVRRILSAFSEDLDVNSINNLERNKAYYLCESEPKKGHTYVHNACKLVNTDDYSGEVLEFFNDSRTYSLRLMKQSDQDILLDGAKFKITYDNFGQDRSVILTTGYLSIERQNNYKYLVYKHENDQEATIVEFNSDYFTKSGIKPGKYYYYQTNDEIINNSLLNDEYQIVVSGGLEIEDLPYSSSLTIEEIEAPKGFIITEPSYHISPDISYSQITFKNYRVNFMDIVPAKKFRIPKTCIDG